MPGAGRGARAAVRGALAAGGRPPCWALAAGRRARAAVRGALAAGGRPPCWALAAGRRARGAVKERRAAGPTGAGGQPIGAQPPGAKRRDKDDRPGPPPGAQARRGPTRDWLVVPRRRPTARLVDGVGAAANGAIGW